MDRNDLGGVKVNIGNVFAHCPKCGADKFTRSKPPPGQACYRFVCVACSTETLRTVLIAQIGEKIQKRAGETLERARAWQRLRKNEGK